ncbi:DUF6559 family protein [Microbulbifer epialgicus]|uniref:DUF6559 family protein n=1 Tax=Microbulbifer epialgicus TaxID=393907 RepID=A0ABV4P694_9GAMM
MNFIKNLFYEFQYSKYVRGLPFYVVRHSGVKKSYSSRQIDLAIAKYGFNHRFTPIGYAILGNKKQFKSKSRAFLPHPSRQYIRGRIAKKYFQGGEFGLIDLMKLSFFKIPPTDDLFIDPNEYWEYLSEIERQAVKNSHRASI